MTDTPMIPAAEAAARVAAAYEAAAQLVGDYPNIMLMAPDQARVCEHLPAAIRALAAADPDGQAALARLLAEARAEGMREAAEICKGVRIAFAGGPMPERASFNYEWAILAAADKEVEHG